MRRYRILFAALASTLIIDGCFTLKVASDAGDAGVDGGASDNDVSREDRVSMVDSASIEDTRVVAESGVSADAGHRPADGRLRS